MNKYLSNSGPALSVEQQELELGEGLRGLRLQKNLGQRVVAERAGVSERALRRLEAGEGSTVATLIAVLGVLGRESWIKTVAPVASINPLSMPIRGNVRQRATRSINKSPTVRALKLGGSSTD